MLAIRASPVTHKTPRCAPMQVTSTIIRRNCTQVTLSAVTSDSPLALANLFMRFRDP